MPPTPRALSADAVRRTGLGFVAVLASLLAFTGCSDLLDSSGEDVLVQLEASDRAEVMRVRQDALASASSWGGVRVGEQTADVGESALEFTLPGENLDIALGALGALDARVVSTDIDVDAPQVDGSGTDPDDGQAEPEGSGEVRLRLEVSEEPAGGLGALLGALVVVFAVVGVISTVRWLGELLRPGRDRRTRPRTRRIERVDLRGEPPTQETPRIPPEW